MQVNKNLAFAFGLTLAIAAVAWGPILVVLVALGSVLSVLSLAMGALVLATHYHDRRVQQLRDSSDQVASGRPGYYGSVHSTYVRPGRTAERVASVHTRVGKGLARMGVN